MKAFFLPLTLVSCSLPMLILALFSGVRCDRSESSLLSAEELLSLGDNALSTDSFEESIEHYERGIKSLTKDDSLIIELSLYTNHATALSSLGKDEEASHSYKTAIRSYSSKIEKITDDDVKKQATDIASHASFFLGMVYQDLNHFEWAADAYSYAYTLDPFHWASLANLGGLLQDSLSQHGEALVAYNKAFEVLTQNDMEKVTDPPDEPRQVLSQLQYRIGLCIAHGDYANRKCALTDDPDKPASCKELATHAFSLAVQYDPENELAKHMLATITADATMKQASADYVKSLFDDYAENFEHSLVDELGYNGYERLRLGFDRCFPGGKVPTFELVVDAGCGTGLVGEQFRNVSQHLMGIDLSQAIIDQAKKMRPNLYDDFKVGDVTEIFKEMKNEISLIIAGDSYIYFGDLEPLFQSMEEGLQDNGYVAFTLENVDEENEKLLEESTPDWRWQLTASGRFAHRREYVESVGKLHQMSLIRYEKLDNFRSERGVGVRGHLFVMLKKSTDGATAEL